MSDDDLVLSSGWCIREGKGMARFGRGESETGPRGSHVNGVQRPQARFLDGSLSFSTSNLIQFLSLFN